MPANAKQPQKKEKKVIQLDKQTDKKKARNLSASKTVAKNKEKEKIISLKGVDPDEIIFSLDIGTRTVVGVVGIPEDDKLKIVAAEVVEHKNRAMLDGQIHDIAQVAEIALEVKKKLEEKLEITLSKVAIAAAGRVLKTCEVRVEREIEQGKEIDQELVSSIEMEGIQYAQIKLDDEVSRDEKTQFYCVGYSVINYYLNGYVISSLIGHKGKKIGVDVLATFLPHIVVDSLYTVMSKIGLEVISLTLEPIAAINVTIPKDLRLLNLALVDIGAGTSDIALTRDGSVVAYAMAPVAGDEITEKIAQHYLVDFNTGEKIKISLSSGDSSVSFVDILGNKQVVEVTEVNEVIEPSVRILADTISQKILEYNHKAPNAVFLIGGGSQIPGLTGLIAEYLKISRERVVVRGRDIIQNIKFSGKKLAGPEAITPFGIAVTAQIQKGQDFLAVTVNGKKVRLFNSKKLTVADALILVGFNPGQLIGRSGKSISFELNGIKRTVRGGYGKAAEIYVNENLASLDTVLKVGDDIRVIPAQDGENAEACVSDYVSPDAKGKVIMNGSYIDIDTRVYINGRIASKEQSIADGDIIQANEIKTLADLANLYEIDLDTYSVFVNGEESEQNYELKNLDNVELKKRIQADELNISKDESVSDSYDTEGKTILSCEESKDAQAEFPTEIINTLSNGSFSGFSNCVSVIINGKVMELSGDKSQYIFVDIFNYIDFDLSKPQGNIVLKLNGRMAGFTDIIRTGDVIEIYWDKQSNEG
ncbi:MAG: rod shape-determining protein [Clostridia bacterium]|nr:rod shape-determining protein [Clostridia bacterium]